MPASTPPMRGAALVVIFMLVTYGLFGLFANVAVAVNVAMIFGVLSLLGRHADACPASPASCSPSASRWTRTCSSTSAFARRCAPAAPPSARSMPGSRARSRPFSTPISPPSSPAAVLFYIGTGPVRGFAVTLGIGILTSLFTAFTLTRLIVAYWVRLWRPRTVPI